MRRNTQKCRKQTSTNQRKQYVQERRRLQIACRAARVRSGCACESSSDENSSDREDEVQAKKDDDDDGDDNDNKGARAPANDDHDDDGEAEDNALTRNAGSGVLARHMTLHSIYDREHC
jgi:hypothetical protein